MKSLLQYYENLVDSQALFSRNDKNMFFTALKGYNTWTSCFDNLTNGGILMRKSKFGTYIILGAFLGGAASLLDKTTRESVVGKSKKAVNTVQYYAQNKDVLKSKIEAEKEKYEIIFERISEDAAYIKDKVDDIKQLTPQVKELVTDTKEAIVESKDEYRTIAAEASQNHS